jgi:hypothetical protein
MSRERARADAGDAMTTALLLKQRAGRFGRAIRPENDPATPEGERPEPLGYVIDAEAVAAAIVERLVAGRTIPSPRRR